MLWSYTPHSLGCGTRIKNCRRKSKISWKQSHMGPGGWRKHHPMIFHRKGASTGRLLTTVLAHFFCPFAEKQHREAHKKNKPWTTFRVWNSSQQSLASLCLWGTSERERALISPHPEHQRLWEHWKWWSIAFQKIDTRSLLSSYSRTTSWFLYYSCLESEWSTRRKILPFCRVVELAEDKRFL
jgi:hypothetical protein